MPGAYIPYKDITGASASGGRPGVKGGCCQKSVVVAQEITLRVKLEFDAVG